MHTLHVFTAGLAVLAASANALTGQANACSQALRLMPFAGGQSFCSSFLAIKTSTIRTTGTTTQSLVTTTGTTTITVPTSTATSSPSTTLVVLETTTPRTTVTSTPLTTSTSTVTINEQASTTTTRPAITVTSSTGMARVRRGLDVSHILKVFAAPAISEACSAFVGNPSPKTTMTLTATATEYTSTFVDVSTSTAEPTTVTSTLDLATETTTQTETASLVTDTDTASEVTEFETTTTLETTTSTITIQPTVTVAPLSGPPPVLRDPVNLWNSQTNVDDAAKRITLPFTMTLYGQSTSSIWVSTNALLGLGSASSAYSNNALPQQLGDGAVVAAFWDDLFIFAGTTQNIYYEIDGNTVTVEYLVSHISYSDRIYHFSAFYDANVPGVVQVKYYQMSEGGSSATIGMQNAARTTVVNFSNNQNVITAGTLLTFDTNANTITSGRF